MKYDAFISYSHEKDRLLARSLQRVIQTLGKPWYRVRTARVFRDETSLTATPELWPTIVDALDNSQFLLLIASREAAKSKWVSQEIEWWLANKSTKTLLIILSEGDIRWDISRGDFAKSSDALSPILFSRFQSEPFWVDLSSWRDAKKDVSADVAFRGLASKIAARLKNIPPEDLWSQELSQQRRNLQIAGFALATLLVLLSFSILQTFLAMKNETVAQLSNMDAAVQLGNYPLAFTNAVALKKPFLLTDAQILKGESQLYEALWSNRQNKIIQLKNNEALLFQDGTEHPIIRTMPGVSLSPEEHEPQNGELLPRHWQKPQGFGTWSKDRRQIRIDIPSSGDLGTPSNVSISLKDCLKEDDDQFLIEKETNSDAGNYLSANELLSNTSRGITARDNLRAPIYYAKNDYGQEVILVEIASLATLENSEYQEVLCVVSINPEEASIIDKYFPDLTLSPSSRIDRNYGLRSISPGARYYVEMANGGALTLRNVTYLSENKEIILDDLSALPFFNNIDGRIAFSKDGNSYIVSGYHREGSWEQPYVVRYEDQEKRKIVLKGHSEAVETVLISDSGRAAVTIESTLIARVWDLSNKPMGIWLRQINTAVIPTWISDFEKNAENKKNKELLTQLDGIGLSNSHAATEPQCERTIVEFGGNPHSPIIGLRDAEEYIGLVDLNKKRLIYKIRQAEFSGELFYFCSPEDAAAFAVEVASAPKIAEEQAEMATDAQRRPAQEQVPAENRERQNARTQVTVDYASYLVGGLIFVLTAMAVGIYFRISNKRKILSGETPLRSRHMRTGESFPRYGSASSKFMLIGISGSLQGHRIAMDNKVFRIGASTDNDLTIPDDDYVSRHHAKLRYDQGSLWLSDLHSRNGTFLNRDRLKESAVRVNIGDRIRMGRSTFEVIRTPDG